MTYRNRGNTADPARCRVTVYTCCPQNTAPTTTRYPENAHQCHNAPEVDGLCMVHERQRIMLLRKSR